MAVAPLPTPVSVAAPTRVTSTQSGGTNPEAADGVVSPAGAPAREMK